MEVSADERMNPTSYETKEANNEVEVAAAQSETQMRRKCVVRNKSKMKGVRRLFLVPPIDKDQGNGVKPLNGVKVVEKVQKELVELDEAKNSPTKKKRKRLFLAPLPTESLNEGKFPLIMPIMVNELSPLRRKKKKSSQIKTSPSIVPLNESVVDDYKPNGNVIAKSEPFSMSLRKRKTSKIFDYPSDEESNVPIKINLPKSLSKPAVVESLKIELSEYELEIKKTIEERKNIFKMLQIGDAKNNLILALKK